ncbi:putative kinase [Corchorus olitorius]|uniref:Kinase n=1 Tax=Corchorus olitorius TaxID=93759 RepID=A0A1R3GER4_9ROSI|nr:putative kinase [Corchorus olitorius]
MSAMIDHLQRLTFIKEAFWLFILEEFPEGSLGCLAISPRLSCACRNRIWKITLFPDSSIVNRKGGSCGFSFDKFDA